MTPSIETIPELSDHHGNRGRWGSDDEKRTLNLLTEEMVVNASSR
ncbi:MAG: hypothetical protein V3S32_04700 [Acidimicrobiia bacterium]